MGTLPDKELAAKRGRTPAAIRNMRVRLGTPLQVDRRPLPWTSEELELLGRVPGEELAVQCGRDVEAFRQRRHKLRIRLALGGRKSQP